MALQRPNDTSERNKPEDDLFTEVCSAQEGLTVEQIFSTEGEHPFDQIDWDSRSAKITDDKGNVIFLQEGVEVPEAWSQLATNVVVSKYFYGEPETDQRETSVKQLVGRVCRTIADWGAADGVFATDADAERFYQDLTYLCVNQYGAFNSPVWFNVGLFHQNGVEGSKGNYHWDEKTNQPQPTMRSYEYPQASACFIQSVDDSMEDIMRLASAEAMLFKYGSGTGTDLSTLRSSREKLSGGGTPSGPLSFMRIYDQVAGVVRSGGKTRRAAKMQSLRCDHPDIKDFIEAKMVEEKKAWALIDAGYDGSFNGDAYASVMYQNSNLSIRVTDEFMQAGVDDDDWQTYAVTTGEPIAKYRAGELLDSIAEGTHICGDPGVQYHSTINKWHTCPNSGEICASNPCSEYMFINDSACNLASLNLMKFCQADGSLDTVKFSAAARLFIIAQEILVDHASYPAERLCKNSHDFRPLGLGYANLGAMLMSLGLPYDSDAGRAVAAGVTALLTGTAYAASAELSSRLGSFEKFTKNRKEMLSVIGMHRDAAYELSADLCPPALRAAAIAWWDQALASGKQLGYRNAQVTVLAPTGTIGFMMDCDTTGVEPDIALVKYKQLAGGGMFKIINKTVPLALERLGYEHEQISEIVQYIEENDTIEGAENLDPEHLAIFDCAFKPAQGTRFIHYMGHIRMMGAVQPFLSGAISKTVNMPTETTVDQIKQVYVDAWQLGLKAVAIYRDGSKRTQPLNVSQVDEAAEIIQEISISEQLLEEARRKPHRHRLPATRPSITHKFDIAGHEGYLNVGLYEDTDQPGELFITMAKEGSTVGGMVDAFATSISLCLQYGVPLEALVKKFSHQRFEPSGMTANRDIPFAKSIVDYIFRWLGVTFLEEYRKANVPNRKDEQAGKTKSKSAPEDAKDGETSESVRAERASSKEATRPLGATNSGTYSASPGGGANNKIGPQAKATSLKTAATEAATNRLSTPVQRISKQFSDYQADAPACDVCGAITVRNGNCYKCYNCGSSLGCS